MSSTTMTSAAEQVFAVHELLEHILLAVYGDSLHIIDKGHTKELFTLQRVSRNFNAAINGSLRLRFKMGVGCPPPELKELARSTALVSPILGHVEMDVYPFTFDEIQEFPDLGGIGDVVIIHLSAGADKFGGAVYENVRGRAGGRTIHRGKHHSWRRLKVTTVGATISLSINIEFQDHDGEDDSDSKPSTHREFLYDDEGKVTLGEIADMLDAMSHRTLNERRALLAFMLHNGSRDYKGTLDINHGMAKCFLSSAGMHLAWMKFEYSPAMKRLKEAIVSNPYFAHQSATERLDQRLDLKNASYIRRLSWGLLDIVEEKTGSMDSISEDLSREWSGGLLENLGSTDKTEEENLSDWITEEEEEEQEVVEDNLSEWIVEDEEEEEEEEGEDEDADEEERSSDHIIKKEDEEFHGYIDKEEEETFYDCIDQAKDEDLYDCTDQAEDEGSFDCIDNIELEGDTLTSRNNTIKQDTDTNTVGLEDANRPSRPIGRVEEVGTFGLLNISRNAQAAYTRVDTIGLYVPDSLDMLLALLLLLASWACYVELLSLLVAMGWSR